MSRFFEIIRRWFHTRTQPVSHKSQRMLEPLESRIAPATLVNPTTITFQDHDGDLVTVKSSKAIFSSEATADLILHFDTGTVSGDNSVKQQLQLVDLTKATSSLVTGANFSVTAVKSGGDGFVDVGYIKAANISLGAVSVQGDLGRIDAGFVTNTTGIKSLTVQSLGAHGTSTQASGGSLNSNITGALGSLVVKSDIDGAFVKVSNGISSAPGKISSIQIGGSLNGGSTASAGFISAAADIGTIKIGGNISGGSDTNTGAINAAGKIGNITIGGAILGSTGAGSGSIVSGTNFSLNGNMGAVKIGGNLQGNDGANSGEINAGGSIASVTIANGSLIGGKGANSGAILSGDSIGAVSIKNKIQGSSDPAAAANSGEILSGNDIGAITVGSIAGGASDYSGFVFAPGNIGAIKVLADISGGAGIDAGTIISGGKIASLTVTGKLTGDAGLNSGSIFSGDNLGAVKIGGDVHGGNGDNSGQINSAGQIAGVTLVKSLLGGAGDSSGAILSGDIMGTVKISGDVSGNIGVNSGQISSATSIGAVTIGGSLIGNNGSNSGAILSHTLSTDSDDIQGNIGAVKILGATGISGGNGDGSGQINAAGTLASVFVQKSVTGGAGNGSGAIFSGTDFVTSGAMGQVTIGGDLQGGDVSGSASLTKSGYIEGQRIAGVTIGGSIISGTNSGTGILTKSGSIRVADDIGAVSVKALVGNASNPVVISARGQATQGATTDLAIKSVTVLTDTDLANILAGYDTDLTPVNPDAQIGAVKVNGLWTASNLIAGVQNNSSSNKNFGENDTLISGSDNPNIISKIASVIIGGSVSGTQASGDHFGFVAQQIGSFKFDGTTVTLHTTPPPDVADPLGLTNDVSLREIA